MHAPNIAGDMPDPIKVQRELSSIDCVPNSCLVRPHKKKSSVIIPDGVRRTITNTGRVVSIGPRGYDDDGKIYEPFVQPGQDILFRMEMACFPIVLDLGNGPEELMLMMQDEIICVLHFANPDEADEAPSTEFKPVTDEDPSA